MHLLTSLRLILILTSWVVSQKVEIIRKFNGLVNDGERGVIAVKTSGDPIDSCIWTNPKGTSYEIGRGSSTTGTVDISERSSLCKLTLNSVNAQNDNGKWSVEVRGKCDFFSKTNSYSIYSGASPLTFKNLNIDNSSAVHFISAPLKISPKAHSSEEEAGFENLKISGKDGCANVAEEDLNLTVVNSNDFEVTPAQDKVYVLQGSPTSLTMRCNTDFTGCKANINRRTVVEMINQERTCGSFEDAKLCLEYYYDRTDNIYSCILLIDRFNSKHEGRWELELSHRVGRRDEFKSNFIDLSQADIPNSVKMTYDNSKIEYPSVTGKRNIEELKFGEGDTARVECSVLGGNPEPSPILQMNRNKFMRLKKCVDSCRNPPRGEICQEFEFQVLKEYDRQELQCGFTMPLFDLSAREQESKRATATVSLGRGGRIDDADDLRLVGTSGTKIKVCAKDLRIGDRYSLEVQFETSSRPFEVEWEMAYLTRSAVIVRYNSESSGYRNIRYRIDGRDKYTAIIEINRVSSSDIDDDHLVMIENDARVKRDFIVDLSNSPNCDGVETGPCKFGDRGCLCNRNRDKCCDDARGCREKCCFICNPRSDKILGEFCCKKKEETTKGCDPFKDGRDCICDVRREHCCLLTRSCTGPNCCEECDERNDSKCLICLRDQCYKTKGSIIEKIDVQEQVRGHYFPNSRNHQMKIWRQFFLEKNFVPLSGGGLLNPNSPVATFKSALSTSQAASTTVSSITKQAQSIINFENAQIQSSTPSSNENKSNQRINNKIFGNTGRRTSATGSEE
ncbi:unnamed protein product [Lepeophtheirus salmonis]|uniref:(salmon louse) hypothetical protein n=1 Tax=Lepeophtheirus salmonis TaxID=72036 RepID=A0A7R8CG07_LEPSM|nr:unnamed protein product [Lepeophtheirus salmonis]CAF2764801.1 unnamed protein product [Lepeophtheirus salmonis]